MRTTADTVSTPARTIRVALLSPCGTGNLGDAAIQDAVMVHLRRRLGNDIAFLGITQVPADTARRHSIAVAPIDRYERPLPYLPESRSRVHADAPVRGDTRSPPVWRLLARMRRALLASPLGEALRWSREALRNTRDELYHMILAFRVAGQLDALLVSGGGQLDDYWGGTLRHPYALWKWSMIARLHGVPTFVVSVGTGTMRSAASRCLFSMVLRSASYRSFRDRHSARVAGVLTNRAERVVPDLALSYPCGAAIPAPPGCLASARVAIAPISYLAPGGWPEADSAAFNRYFDQLRLVCAELLAAGAQVRIVSTTPSDLEVARRLEESLRGPSPSPDAGLLINATTVDGLLNAIDGSHLVIASRLHAAILAVRKGRPVVALSYDWKVDRFVLDAGLSSFRQHCLTFEAHRVANHVNRIVVDYAEISSRLRRFAAAAEGRLSVQYDNVAAIIRRGVDARVYR